MSTSKPMKRIAETLGGAPYLSVFTTEQVAGTGACFAEGE